MKYRYPGLQKANKTLLNYITYAAFVWEDIIHKDIRAFYSSYIHFWNGKRKGSF